MARKVGAGATRRTAEQIGRTQLGPRPIPELGSSIRGRAPTSAAAVLPSGLAVTVVRKARTPLVELRLRIPFGGRSQVHAARAELLAATMLLGTGSRSRAAVDAELATVGGHLQTGVDPQRLLISGSVLSTGLPLLLDVLTDTLTDPAFRPHDLRGERDRLVEQVMIAASQPSVVARRHLQLHRFGDHPVAWEMPEPDILGRVSGAAVRGLHGRAVMPQGSTLVLVGDVSPTATLSRVASAMDGWSGELAAVGLATPPAVAGGPIAAFHRGGAVQSQVRLSAAAPDRSDPGYPAAQLANLIYGGYFSSRLVENIREDKGYTYGAHSALEFWPARAAVTVSFDTNTASTAPALLETLYELGRISLVPPTRAEVEAARSYALGSLATSLASQAGYASTLSALAGVGLDESWLRGHPAALAATTVEQVATAAADMLAPAAVTGVVVGDLDAIGETLRALGGVTLP